MNLVKSNQQSHISIDFGTGELPSHIDKLETQSTNQKLTVGFFPHQKILLLSNVMPV